MSYQYKESKTNVKLCYIYIDEKLLNDLQVIADFEHKSRSKVLSNFIQAGGYYEIYKKNLHKKKCVKKYKKVLQKRENITQCLPYFANKGVK